MGYSCTVDASNMLGVIRHTLGKPKTGNTLILRDGEYFFERGREQADGAITGKLFKILPNDMAQEAGSFKIGPEGQIIRFPRLTPNQREELANTFADMRARNPQLLRSWSMGVL